MWGKLLLSLAILSMPASANIPPVRKPLPQPKFTDSKLRSTKGGRWYMAVDGHAVFCYGPTMLIRTTNGDFEKVATFCRGDKVIVPLHE